MTLAPHDDRNVIGLDGPNYELNEYCPICGWEATERHHIFRRSQVIGDKSWVYIPSEAVVVGNCVKLCHKHHQELTDGYAKLEWIELMLSWTTMAVALAPLKWQPPIFNVTEDEVYRWGMSYRDFQPDEKQRIMNQKDHVRPHEHDHSDSDVCYACKRRIPKKREKTEEKKIRRTWSVSVPVDQQENGAEILETLIEEARKEMFGAGLPYGDEKSAIYYVLSTALALFVQHAQGILGDD